MQSIAADYPYSHDGAPEMQRAHRKYHTIFLQKNQVLFEILQKIFFSSLKVFSFMLFPTSVTEFHDLDILDERMKAL